jgi:hypothetical protein
MWKSQKAGGSKILEVRDGEIQAVFTLKRSLKSQE